MKGENCFPVYRENANSCAVCLCDAWTDTLALLRTHEEECSKSRVPKFSLLLWSGSVLKRV